MRRTGPCLLVPLLAACAAIALSACGEDKTPIVRVGDHVITKGQLKHVLHGSDVPDPPAYAKCIARMRAQPGSPRDTATLRGACHYEYTQVVTSELAALIHFEWVRREAKAAGVTL